MKVKAGRSKWLMREALGKFVPQTLIDRPKMGFSVPIESWMRSSLRIWACDQFVSERMRDAVLGFVGVEPAALTCAERSRGYTAYQRWSLAVLGAWIEAQKAGR
jgi:asparagine synthase (glutamine-hydrolysing)